MKLSAAQLGVTLASLLFPVSGFAQSQTAVKSDSSSKFYVDSFFYEDEVISSSEKQGAGQNADLEAVLKYQYSEHTYARFRLQILGETPEYDPTKTSRLDLGLFHREGRVFGFLELTLDGNDKGGTSIGLDDSSRYTMIGVDIHSELNIVFHPFNLGTKIGDEFETDEVAEVHYLDAPIDVITNIPVGDEKLISETTPGFMVNWNPEKTVSVSAGFGVNSFLYPAGKDVTIEEGLVSTAWEKKQSNAVVFRASYDNKKSFGVYVEHASQDSADKAGSLLGAASSVSGYVTQSFVRFSTEVTGTKASRNPYHLDGSWFANNQATRFNTKYVDIFDEPQDWIGEQGLAYMAKFEFLMKNITPFVTYKNYSEHFIFNDKKSAHILRTADLTESHGGLVTYSLGTKFKYEGFEFIPELEQQTSQNDVFLDPTKVRSDSKLSEYTNSNTVFRVYVNYNI